MKDTYDFTYAGDLRHFIGVLLDDYCPTQLKIGLTSNLVTLL